MVVKYATNNVNKEVGLVQQNLELSNIKVANNDTVH